MSQTIGEYPISYALERRFLARLEKNERRSGHPAARIVFGASDEL
jgi:hypothetical protein